MSTAAGRYQVLKHLASGGMAEVFLARERNPSGIEKLVVLKRVLPAHAKDADYLRMFRDEGRIGALLQHPNLVQMFEMGTLEGSPYISMEYLNGEDIRNIFRVLRRRGEPMRLDMALTILSGVLAGLHCAHDAVGVDGQPLSIVHRDVSPQNVIVTYEGGVKVVDFGIARAENRLNKTENAVLKGKVAYMAPEQVLGDALDRRADVYAVGVMLYEMTTGQRPYQQMSEVAIIRAILDVPVEPPTSLVPGYPPELAAIVMKALAKNRVSRFQTAQELQEALEGFAVSRGMSLSTLSLGRFMRDLFGERAEAYRAVLAGTASAEVLQPASKADEQHEDATHVNVESPVTTAPQAAVRPFPASEHAEFQRVGPVTVVSFKGKLNEKFQGAEVGQSLGGDVVFDLRRVERVTSFGVREWLQMLGTCEQRLTSLYLVNCSEPVVSQLSMVKKFAGPGRVVSFFAPYQCPACGQSFQGMLDVDVHADALDKGQVPQQPCSACREPADFDDDARSYLAFGPARLGTLPPAVEAALKPLRGQSQAAPERVEKLIEGSVTRVKVRAPLDASLRWRRVLDGVEGGVAVDLTDVPRFETAGIRQLGTALATLGEDVTSVKLLGAPRAVVEASADALLQGRVELESVVLEGQCVQCNAPRSSLVKVAELKKALALRAPPPAPCRRCEAALSLGDISWLAVLVGRQAPAHEPLPPPVPTAAMPRRTTGLQRSATSSAVRAQPPTGAPVEDPFEDAAPTDVTLPALAGRRRTVVLVLVGLVLAAVGLGGGMWRAGRSEQAAVRTPPPTPSPSPPQPPVRPMPPAAAAVPPAEAGGLPDWAQGPAFVESPSQVTAWARGGPLPGVQEAASAAEAAALARLSEEFLPKDEALRDAWQRRFGATPLTGTALRSALERRLGGALQLQVVQGKAQDGDVAWARVRVPRKDYGGAQADAGRVFTYRGATLAALPPQFGPPPGALYVVKVDEGTAGRAAGLREGDLVLELDGRPVPFLSLLEKVAAETEGRPASMRVDAQGLPRTLKVNP
jgi:serine/threonine protein kinase/anti-anti-sigma regulatory factor